MSLKYEHLLGRSYCPRKQNCYTMVREIYADNFAIDLRDYPFPVDWDANTLDLIGPLSETFGAIKLEDWSIKTLRPGDVMAMAVRSANPNHFAAYVGENKVVHHLWGHLSREETLRDFWRMSTCFVLRHPDVPDLTPVKPITTIQELARARYDLSFDAEAQ